jgi:hypothetical protein
MGDIAKIPYGEGQITGVVVGEPADGNRRYPVTAISPEDDSEILKFWLLAEDIILLDAPAQPPTFDGKPIASYFAGYLTALTSMIQEDASKVLLLNATSRLLRVAQNLMGGDKDDSDDRA